MGTRKIVNIDESKCNGCGLCIPNCAEGALQIVDGKAKLIKDIYCDGLGACLGHCPTDAISIIEREAEEFDEEEVHLHLEKDIENKNPLKQVFKGCPGSRIVEFKKDAAPSKIQEERIESSLRQWPVQLKLVPSNAPYFKGADLLVTADCVPFAYSNYHKDFLQDKAVVVGCPKLDDINYYSEKLEEIIKFNALKIITVLRMEVPCCSGIVAAVKNARMKAGVDIPIHVAIIGIQGEVISQDII